MQCIKISNYMDVCASEHNSIPYTLYTALYFKFKSSSTPLYMYMVEMSKHLNEGQCYAKVNVIHKQLPSQRTIDYEIQWQLLHGFSVMLSYVHQVCPQLHINKQKSTGILFLALAMKY